MENPEIDSDIVDAIAAYPPGTRFRQKGMQGIRMDPGDRHVMIDREWCIKRADGTIDKVEMSNTPIQDPPIEVSKDGGKTWEPTE